MSRNTVNPAKSGTGGRTPDPPVILTLAERPAECHSCTWQPAGAGKFRLKIVHGNCKAHRDLPTIAC